jgi:hypothetical protein
MIGKVRFPQDVQTRDITHQVIVNPETTHRVVHRWINAHRSFVAVVVRQVTPFNPTKCILNPSEFQTLAPPLRTATSGAKVGLLHRFILALFAAEG